MNWFPLMLFHWDIIMLSSKWFLKSWLLQFNIINKKPEIFDMSARNFWFEYSYPLKIEVLNPFSVSCDKKFFCIQVFIWEIFISIFIEVREELFLHLIIYWFFYWILHCLFVWELIVLLFTCSSLFLLSF